MVSHELRTPITVVLGMAQTLVGRPDLAATADGQEILQRVVRQGKRLRDMVEQLLQASAFVANRSPVLRAEGVMAAEVVAEVVDDQGEGVAEIDRERIFSPFTQLDASTTRKVGGVRLGLFLVDRLVRGMGGRVWVEDNQGGGARFMVELPDQAPV
jgi:signal transduction histidine kinase